MDSKKVIEKLLKIAENQQKIITKLAQQVTGADPSPMEMHPQVSQKRPAEAILAALPANVRAAVSHLEVGHNNDVKVRANPGVSQQAVYNGVLKTVTQLQDSNVLQGQSYTVTLVN